MLQAMYEVNDQCVCVVKARTMRCFASKSQTTEQIKASGNNKLMILLYVYLMCPLDSLLFRDRCNCYKHAE